MHEPSALHTDKKIIFAENMMAKLQEEFTGHVKEEGEEKEKRTKNIIQMKSGTILPKQNPRRRELKMALMKQENLTKDRKHDLIFMERQKAVLELSLMTKRSEILKMDKAIAKEERRLEQLRETIEKENLTFEEFLRENEKKTVEARTYFERETKSKQEKKAEIKKLTAEIGAIKSELVKSEETLTDYRRYKELLFKLSPPEWQEAQKVKALKAKVPSDRTEPGESGFRKGKYTKPAFGLCVNLVHGAPRFDWSDDVSTGLESEDESPGRALPSTTETSLPSTHRDTLISGCKQDSDSSDYEDEPELYFTDPQQLLDLVSELTEQILSLIHNSAREEERLKELQQSMETTRRNIEKDEEPLKLQINDMNQRINKEKTRVTKLKQKVQLHISLNTEDQDVMLNTLGQKVAEVYHCCVNDAMTNLSTLEMLAAIESRMSSVLQSLESIPEESLEMMRKIKDKERRSRQREEKLREQREKQKERMRRYLERSQTDARKITGRRLMPRSKPIAQKVTVSNVDNSPDEEDNHDYLFTPEDLE
ncbi:cilia- and flagella-associated protein 100 [Antennarius striatus]|uniref:cilia- and flagella-associated protein 100 n=1 Tax=Antennarius striatus TaxID=241820 RepID=UPI0035B12109